MVVYESYTSVWRSQWCHGAKTIVSRKHTLALWRRKCYRYHYSPVIYVRQHANINYVAIAYNNTLYNLITCKRKRERLLYFFNFIEEKVALFIRYNISKKINVYQKVFSMYNSLHIFKKKIIYYNTNRRIFVNFTINIKTFKLKKCTKYFYKSRTLIKFSHLSFRKVSGNV